MGNHSSSEKDTFLNLCQSGDVKRLRALMQEFKIHDLEKFLHFADHNGMTGLHFAAENGHDKVLEFLLLEKHVVFENLLRGTIRANTPLHLAARANRPSCAKVLLRAANQGTWEQVKNLRLVKGFLKFLSVSFAVDCIAKGPLHESRLRVCKI